ncbi:MAG: delta-60 repeat domain-containing protein [Desulfovibrionaceae bacterium]|nr:delta-60 repeat domain-containing protein [Desulfovibrionaceae bacterium]
MQKDRCSRKPLSDRLSRCTLPFIVSFFLLFSLPGWALATPGDLDPWFDPGSGAEKKPVIRGLYQESATAFLVFGSFATVNGSNRSGVVKINAAGGIDAGFTPPDVVGEVRAVVRRSDGKYLIGGNFTIAGINYYDLVLLHASGALDNTFWAAFAGQGTINSLALQSDDQVLCGGVGLQLTNEIDNPTRHLIRVQANGFADGSYPVFNGPRAYVTRLATDSENPSYPDRLQVLGALNPGSTNSINWRTYLTNTGSVLISQPDGASNDGPILAVLGASDGKSYVAGNFTKAFGVTANRIFRRNSDGTLDASFNIGTGPNGDVTGALRLGDDSLIVVGAFTAFNGTACNRIVKLTPTGAVDATFAVGSGANAPILSIGTLDSGAIYLTGGFTAFNGQSRGGLAVIQSGGALQGTFAGFTPAGSATVTTAVNDLAVQSDGKIVIGGEFNWFGGVWSPGLARLNSNGGVDTGFSAGLGPDGVVHDVAVRSDGRIFAAGDVGGVATRPLGGVARFTSTGGVDTTFSPIVTRNDNSPAPVYAVLPLAGNQVMVGGHVRKIAGQERSPLARLNADGSLDAAFTPQIAITSGTSLSTYALAGEETGKYYVGGYVTYDGLARGFFTRLTSTGSMDATFAPTSPSPNVVLVTSTVREIAVQPDGKPIFCGDFEEIIDGSFWNRPIRRGLARFTATGGLEDFNSGMGATLFTYVESLHLEPNGGVLFTGGFTKFNEINRARLARSTTAGGLDASFNPGTGVTARARVIRRVGLTRGLVGGDFATYAGVSRPGLAGFVLDPQPTVNPAPAALLLLQE